MPRKTVAIVQSSYLPWKGYFDLINLADFFVFWDDVQYTPRNWRNRNRIKTPQGTKWLTVPCGSSRERLICDVEIRDNDWQRSHWSSLCASYRRAPNFHSYREFFEDFYLSREWTQLSEMNHYAIRHIASQMLCIDTPFADSRDFSLQEEDRVGRVIELLKRVEATEYLVGPTAKEYFDPADFEREGIALTWMDYSGYREYAQLYPPFEHAVSIVDLLFSVGPAAPGYLKTMDIAPQPERTAKSQDHVDGTSAR